MPDVAQGGHPLWIKTRKRLQEGLVAYHLVGGVTAYQGFDG
jgi:hypothetical protein